MKFFQVWEEIINIGVLLETSIHLYKNLGVSNENLGSPMKIWSLQRASGGLQRYVHGGLQWYVHGVSNDTWMGVSNGSSMGVSNKRGLPIVLQWSWFLPRLIFPSKCLRMWIQSNRSWNFYKLWTNQVQKILNKTKIF